MYSIPQDTLMYIYSSTHFIYNTKAIHIAACNIPNFIHEFFGIFFAKCNEISLLAEIWWVVFLGVWYERRMLRRMVLYCGVNRKFFFPSEWDSNSKTNTSDSKLEIYIFTFYLYLYTFVYTHSYSRLCIERYRYKRFVYRMCMWCGGMSPPTTHFFPHSFADALHRIYMKLLIFFF